MRIAFMHNLPSGGAKRSAFEFLRRMTPHHEVDLFIIDPASETYLDLRPLAHRTTFIEGPRPRGGLGVLTTLAPARRAWQEVARQVNAGGYDVAFVMQCKLSNSPFVLPHLRVPSLYFCHEPLARTLEEHFWTGAALRGPKRAVVHLKVALDRENAKHATLICANSRYSAECIYRAYGVHARFNRLGVDLETFRPLGATRERSILSVGALHPVKAQDLIIRGVSTLAERPPVNFIFNSDSLGTQVRLTALAESLRVPIAFHRLVEDADLVTAYNRAAVVAFPSCLEPFGFVPLEAMACGAAVVGVAEGGTRETVLDGVTGLLTDRNPEAFGRAIGILLADESMRHTMGAAGRRHVSEHWTWEQAAADLEANLQGVASRGTSGGRL